MIALQSLGFSHMISAIDDYFINHILSFFFFKSLPEDIFSFAEREKGNISIAFPNLELVRSKK